MATPPAAAVATPPVAAVARTGPAATTATAATTAPATARAETARRNGNSISDPGGFSGEYHIDGTFSTKKLVAAASELRSLGLPADEVIAKVYPPFIIAGESAWTDTWGAPRYGPGPIVRTHEGQDVFCKYGDPILAPEDGTMSYSDGGLGGITVTCPHELELLLVPDPPLRNELQGLPERHRGSGR